MNGNDINILVALVNVGAMFFLTTALMGVGWKFLSMLLAVFAYPIYLALYLIELLLGARKNIISRVLSLNIPNQNPMKFIMNASASMVVVFMLSNFRSLIMAYKSSAQDQANILFSMLYGSDNLQIIFNSLVLLFITVIYVISFFTEEDTRDPWDKIDNLSIPSLWKSIVNKI